jgi:GNAT superfamily N-acetyltransferase
LDSCGARNSFSRRSVFGLALDARTLTGVERGSMLGALAGSVRHRRSVTSLMPMPPASPFALRSATVDDLPVILACIRGLAEYEKLAHEVVATEALLRETLFGAHPVAEVMLAFRGEEAAGFALFFHNYSTFLARPGLYLEDLFVFPRFRGQGLGRLLLARLARIALDRGCGRLEWSVLDWNVDAIRFYESVGAQAMTEWTVNRVTGDALQALAASCA